ncbi:transporter [Leptobacterium flavescens]|uniref:Transporter n=1 Tax=Leptobacterium flavescens TaxID=472055 RepID=A0A6P0UPU7_9FLAO|nr:transporter [Leptobacterium flavescens]NER14532.1 transporter [Leptobacterium flavescens]
MKKIYLAIILLATGMIYAQENENKDQKWSGSRPDGHAPISVMGDHTHGKGEWMVSYRYMYMNMEDLKLGSDDVPFSAALAEYMVTPTSMPMNMHMLGVMYAPSNRVTLMVMGNYISQEMDHVTRMGGTFTTSSSGIGDTKVSAFYKFFNRNRQQLHAEGGLSIPTGSIDEEDVIPASAPNSVILPYPMQIGSGTWDFSLALTYLAQTDLFSFGSQLRTLLRTGTNDNEYRLGNRYESNNWVAVKATNWLSFSARVQGLITGEINGLNPALNPAMVITADTDNSGGTFVNSGIGFNTYVPKGALKNLRFGFEFAFPLYQDLNGFQLKRKETLTFGLQYAFK